MNTSTHTVKLPAYWARLLIHGELDPFSTAEITEPRSKQYDHRSK